MRNSVRPLVAGDACDHVGLAYTTLAPVGVDGGVPDKNKASWLEQLAETRIAEDYPSYADAWLASFAGTSARAYTLVFDTRLLVGHGNSSATDVGLTLHHTWGTPIVPGSALKGIVAHHVAEQYGPDPTGEAPDPTRDAWRGVGWEGAVVARGPGPTYRALLGAPDAGDDRATGAPGAARGHVTFHDALYLGLAAENDGRVITPARQPTMPFASDVITVHQKSYYDGRGASAPNDHDDPIPVSFLTVRRKARFAVVLEGPADWTLLAGQLLREALTERRIGGKGTSDYGRATLTDARLPPPPLSVAALGFRQWLEELAAGKTSQRDVLAKIIADRRAGLLALPLDDRQAVAGMIRRAIGNRRLQAQRDEFCAALLGEVLPP